MSTPGRLEEKKRYSPMAYNKATVRRRIVETTNRFKKARDEEIVEQLDRALHVMFDGGLLPFSRFDLRSMKFSVGHDENGMVVYLPERLKKWLNKL